jgi:hypothetical protein
MTEQTKSIQLEVTEVDGGLSVGMKVIGFSTLELIGILQLQISDVLDGMNKERAKAEASISKFPNGGNFTKA